MDSIFSKIISGQLPSFKIAEDDKHFAFLDINPNSIGHTLCVTKKQVDKLLDLTQEEYLNLMAFSRRVAKAIEKSVPCNRISLSVIGLEVPHVHVHLIPIKNMDEATFRVKIKLTDKKMAEIADQIKSNFWICFI